MSSNYTKSLDFGLLVQNKRVSLDLGNLTSVALVKVNGVSVGNVQALPYKLDISGAIHNGENLLEINVTNKWMNRFIGDVALPSEQRQTWVSYVLSKPGQPCKPLAYLVRSA